MIGIAVLFGAAMTGGCATPSQSNRGCRWRTGCEAVTLKHAVPPAAGGPTNGASSNPTLHCNVDPVSVLEINLAQPYDYMSIRRLSEADVAGSIVILSQAGAPCSDARDASCSQRLAQARWANDVGPWFVATRGDQVTIVPVADLPALFGTIDTPTEALFLVRRDGYLVGDCRTARALDGGGYEVRAWQWGSMDCASSGDSMQATSYVLDVHADGSIEQRSATLLEEPCGAAVP